MVKIDQYTCHAWINIVAILFWFWEDKFKLDKIKNQNKNALRFWKRSCFLQHYNHELTDIIEESCMYKKVIMNILKIFSEWLSRDLCQIYHPNDFLVRGRVFIRVFVRVRFDCRSNIGIEKSEKIILNC